MELINTTYENTVLHTLLDQNKLFYKNRSQLSKDCFTGDNITAFGEIVKRLDSHQPVNFKILVNVDSKYSYLYTCLGSDEHEFNAYLKELNRLKKLRLQHSVGLRLIEKVKIDSDPDEITNFIYNEISQNSRKREPRTHKQILSDLSNRVAKGGGLIGLSTGLKSLDSFTGGFNPSNLVIMAGRPGQGKTAQALSHAVLMAKKGVKVVYINIEMDDTELDARIISMHHSIELERILRGNLDMDKWNKQYLNDLDFLENIEVVSDLVELNDIVSEIHYLNSLGKADVAIIDYLQLIHGDRSANREREVSSISLGFKNLAKRLKMPVVLLSQLSREVEKRPDRMPRLSDLRDSGSIEQDADIVVFLYRPEYYGFEEFNGVHSSNLMINLISKNRNGKTGECLLSFIGSFTRIEERNEGIDFGKHGITEGIAKGFDPDF